MKRIILVLLAVLTIFVLYSSVSADEVIVPSNSIRLRVIPNSNSSFDQAMKLNVKEYLEKDVYTLFKNIDNIDDARIVISDNLDNINSNIQSIFEKYNYDMDFMVNFGSNYFPEKIYRGVTYKSGYYESLVVSIGEANGDNFWCVLFPNLCIVDESNVSYTSLVKEIVNRVFNS